MQLSGDETQWVLQQLQGLEEKNKIATIIKPWPLDGPDMTVAPSELAQTLTACNLRWSNVHIATVRSGCP